MSDEELIGRLRQGSPLPLLTPATQPMAPLPPDHPLARVNAARARTTAAGPIARGEHLPGFRAEYPHVPVCTLEELEQQAPAATAQIDAGRESHLVDVEALRFGMHPFTPLLDVGRERQSQNKQPHIYVDTMSGELLLPLDTVVAWT